jgi:hypothetical protein
MDPLGSGDHFASAWGGGIVVRRGTWSVDSADPAAVVESLPRLRGDVAVPVDVVLFDQGPI